VLFRRSLFQRLGGFAEELAAYEDWHLWVRYSMDSTFCAVDKTTAIQRRGAGIWAPAMPEGSRAVVEAMNQELARRHRPEEFQAMVDELERERQGAPAEAASCRVETRPTGRR
jgi:hypothetical protein